MKNQPTSTNVQPLPKTGEQRLQLDQTALDAAKRSLEDGAVTPSYGPWREDIVKLLNDALA
ncbi:MAG: ferritin-like domain-containing protein, partial [Caldimonas sp.]